MVRHEDVEPVSAVRPVAALAADSSPDTLGLLKTSVRGIREDVEGAACPRQEPRHPEVEAVCRVVLRRGVAAECRLAPLLEAVSRWDPVASRPV